MKKPTVFLTGAAGGMGWQSLIRMIKDYERYNTLILVRDSEKNRRLLSELDGHPGLEIVWGDLNEYDKVFSCVEKSETVCLLSKLSEAKHHISVQVDMDELDLTSAESKATYEEIQEWVQEKYGFHVTHLNIAQVKRKHGIIERVNYNKPKSPDSKQPGCPEDKTRAIEAALKHFQMI